jgi:hypothetical protein
MWDKYDDEVILLEGGFYSALAKFITEPRLLRKMQQEHDRSGCGGMGPRR